MFSSPRTDAPPKGVTTTTLNLADAEQLLCETALKETDNVKFLKYLNDRELCPEGRRYWVIIEAGRANNLRTILPTARAKETFQIEDTTSNKFTLLSFIL